MTVLEISLSASLLILAVFAVRALALHRLPKMTFVVLWGIALCRLLIPVSVTSRFSVYAALDRLPGLSPGSSASPIDRIVDQSAVAPVHTVLLVWAAGTVACALYFLIPHLSYRRQYRTALPIDSAFITEWLRDHRTLRPVRVRQLDRITAPLTYGILRPVILLPKAMDLTDETQLAYVLAHELTHIRRFDTLCKWLLALCACIHWFNPLMWVMYVLANRDMEYACDEAVVRSFGASRRSAYAHMLLSLEEKRSRHTPLFSHFSKNANKERIHAIMKLKKTTVIGIAAASLLVIAVAVFFATTGPAQDPAAPESNEAAVSSPMPNSAGIEEKTLIRFTDEQNIEHTIIASDYDRLLSETPPYSIDTEIDGKPLHIYVQDEGKCTVITSDAEK
jgi:bla regulator protein BlaR1